MKSKIICSPNYSVKAYLHVTFLAVIQPVIFYAKAKQY